MRANHPLLTPVRLGKLTLNNRVVMAPMTREECADGLPDERNRDYYARRSIGGTGLIITEGCSVNADGSFGTSVPRLYGEDAEPAWRPLVSSVQAGGASILAQLWHVGAFSPSLIGMRDSLDESVRRLSPSGLAGPGQPFGDAMSVADIERTISDFANAAAMAHRCGFDGVEIHAAHGYLPDQFFWHKTNQRSDRYGGSLSDRARFTADVIRACRRATSEEFTISVRISQWKQLDFEAQVATNANELEAWLTPMVDAGADIFHASTRKFWQPAFADSKLSFSAWVRKLSGKPTIAVGSVTLGNDFKSAEGKTAANATPEQLELIETCLQRGDFDLLALGRALLANPDWVTLVTKGRAAELQPFTRDLLDNLI